MRHTFAVLAVVLTLGSGLIACGPPPQAASATPQPTTPSPLVTAQPEDVGEPTRVVIPTIGVDEALEGVGLNPDGSMHVPGFGRAGWYEPGPRPGAPGPAVIVAHVHGPDGPDVFWRLHELRQGDLLTVQRADGVTTFVVDRTEQVPKDELPVDRIWDDTERPTLRLVTCAGERDAAGQFPDNTIVYARAL